MQPVTITTATAPDSLPPARRRSRRPFHPSRHVDPVYRLPPTVADRLAAALQGRRTAERAYRLAIYLARHWSAPAALLEAFTVAARRFDGTGGLVDVLGMTAAEIRGALKALEEVGFVVREIGKGNGFKPTAFGLRKAPIRFRFGPDYWPLFKAANARSTNSHRGRGFAPRDASRRDSAGLPVAAFPKPTAAAGTRFDPNSPPPRETQTSTLGFTPSREARFWRELAATAGAERLAGLSRDRSQRFSLSPAALAAIARGGDR